MLWFFRLALWATLFAWPCWKLTVPWQWALGQTAEAVLRVFRLDVTFSEVALSAPMDIGFYAALCLAGRRGPLRERVRALALGIPVLAGAELAAVLVTVGISVASSGAGSSLALRWTGYLIETVPWVSAAGVWWGTLGAREFGHLFGIPAVPAAAGQRKRREPRASGARPSQS